MTFQLNDKVSHTQGNDEGRIILVNEKLIVVKWNSDNEEVSYKPDGKYEDDDFVSVKVK